MRLFFSVLCSAVWLAAVARADPTDAQLNPFDPLAGVPPPLAAALRQFGQDSPRWAYTQRFTQFDKEGNAKDSWVARFDPSQHYDVQWTLLEENGKPPTERAQNKFRKTRAKRSKERRTLGELLMLPRATIAFQSNKEIVYEVPLKLEDGTRFPPEKFQVFVTLDREKQQLKLLDVKLRDNIRVVGVINVKAGDARLEFTPVVEGHGPALTAISAGGTASLLFVTVGARAEAVRTDYKRVTPYDERFKVELGPLKAIDF